MPSRKQRRRRDKARRHDYEYVYVDEEGREVEVEADTADTRPAKAKERDRAPAGRRGRPLRKVEPPSWRRVARRAGIFAPFMFGVIWLTNKDAPVGARLLIALSYTFLFVPFFYFVDRMAYRAYLRRSGGGPGAKAGKQ